MQDLITRVQALKKKKADAEQQKSRLQGRKDQLMQQLKNEFGCSTLEEARERHVTMNKDITRRQERARRMLAEIEEAIK